VYASASARLGAGDTGTLSSEHQFVGRKEACLQNTKKIFFSKISGLVYLLNNVIIERTFEKY
jgi:hypothetical protein